jgi:divalent anion:Na+ symporter, DASS family
LATVPATASRKPAFWRWGIAFGLGLAIAAAPAPSGISVDSWRLLAVFAATVAGLIAQPAPGGFVVLLGITTIALFGIMPIQKALAGYADPIVWLVLAACLMSRGMIKTGLGRRIAYVFIRAIGHRTLGLGYALVGCQAVLASFIPSTGARCGGIVFPIARSLGLAYGSEPGPTARRLGAFLIVLLYQCEVLVCATFLTGQASNALMARLALQGTGFELTYGRWLLGALVPALLSLVVVPPLLYLVFPPEVKRTPGASAFAAAELVKMGPMTRAEGFMLFVFSVVAVLWMTTAFHGVHYSAVALVGICVLLLSGVLDWNDVLGERGAWDIFIWYGGLVRMAEALGETGLTRRFAESTAALAGGLPTWASVGLLLLAYFYAHYGFASITAHASAMYAPFLAVMIALGAPGPMAALLLAYCSNLCASLTHYGTTPGPILFGAGYVSQGTWWRLGLLVSVPNLVIWVGLGLLWWKWLGWF